MTLLVPVAGYCLIVLYHEYVACKEKEDEI